MRLATNTQLIAADGMLFALLVHRHVAPVSGARRHLFLTDTARVPHAVLCRHVLSDTGRGAKDPAALRALLLFVFDAAPVVGRVVLLQLLPFAEPPAAVFTRVRLVAGVRLNVSSQVVPTAERLLAHVAGEPAHLVVPVAVLREQRVVGELAAADRAGVRRLAGVFPLVRLALLRAGEALAAVLALVRLLAEVAPGVLGQVPLDGERPVAERAVERFLAVVRPDVRLQLGPLVEPPSAVVALEPPFGRVRGAVLLQLGHTPESLRALVAAERSLAFVALNVHRQLSGVGVLHLADAALVRLVETLVSMERLEVVELVVAHDALVSVVFPATADVVRSIPFFGELFETLPVQFKLDTHQVRFRFRQTLQLDVVDVDGKSFGNCNTNGPKSDSALFQFSSSAWCRVSNANTR